MDGGTTSGLTILAADVLYVPKLRGQKDSGTPAVAPARPKRAALCDLNQIENRKGTELLTRRD